jgi:hypothetical protein
MPLLTTCLIRRGRGIYFPVNPIGSSAAARLVDVDVGSVEVDDPVTDNHALPAADRGGDRRPQGRAECAGPYLDSDNAIVRKKRQIELRGETNLIGLSACAW